MTCRLLRPSWRKPRPASRLEAIGNPGAGSAFEDTRADLGPCPYPGNRPMATAEALGALVEQALADVNSSATLAALDEVRVRLLGKKGLLTEQLKGLGALSAAERPAAGQRINDAKTSIQTALDARHGELDAAALARELSLGAL